MSRQGPAARTVAHSGPPQWNATPSRMGVDGSCEWGWGAFVSFNPGFPQPAKACLCWVSHGTHLADPLASICGVVGFT